MMYSSIQQLPKFGFYRASIPTRPFHSIPTTGGLRRSMLYVPGHDAKKLSKLNQLQADSLILDLEDGVPMSHKLDARRQLHELCSLPEPKTTSQGAEWTVRIQALDAGQAEEELKAVLAPPNSPVQTIVIPKVHRPSDVHRIEEYISRWAPKRSIGLIPCIESARGVLSADAIAQSSSRVVALMVAAEDLCADMGLRRTPHRGELAFARGMVVTAAKAAQVDAIDIVCIDLHDTRQLDAECQEGRDWGYTGKQVIHPKQLEMVHQAFSPSQAEVNKANHILIGYQEHCKQGKGAFVLDGKVVDQPVVKWADKIIQAHNTIRRSSL